MNKQIEQGSADGVESTVPAQPGIGVLGIPVLTGEQLVKRFPLRAAAPTVDTAALEELVSRVHRGEAKLCHLVAHIDAHTARVVDAVAPRSILHSTVAGLSGAGLRCAADIVQMHVEAFKGRDYLPRDPAMARITQWRVERDQLIDEYHQERVRLNQARQHVDADLTDFCERKGYPATASNLETPP